MVSSLSKLWEKFLRRSPSPLRSSLLPPLPSKYMWPFSTLVPRRVSWVLLALMLLQLELDGPETTMVSLCKICLWKCQFLNYDCMKHDLEQHIPPQLRASLSQVVTLTKRQTACTKKTCHHRMRHDKTWITDVYVVTIYTPVRNAFGVGDSKSASIQDA